MKEKNQFQVRNKRDSDIIVKIIKIYPEITKFRIHGLCPPTFSPQLATNLASLYDQIKPQINQIRPPFNKTQETLEKINVLLPNLCIFISQNFLQSTITSFQANINNAYLSLQDVITNNPASQSSLEGILNFMKNIVSKSYSMDFPKMSRKFYDDLNSNLDELIQKINLNQDIPQNNLFDHFSKIISKSSELLKHLTSSHCLIRATRSFISLFVKLRHRNAIPYELEPHAILSKPKKPAFSIESSQDAASTIPIPQLLNDFKLDPDYQNKIDDYVKLFNSILSNEYKFSPPLNLFQHFLQNLASATLDKSLFEALLKLFLEFYQLPKQAKSIDDIFPFVLQLADFDKLLQAALQNSNDALLLMEHFTKSICDLLMYFNHIKSAVESADTINSTLEVTLVFTDLTEIHPDKPDFFFSLHNIPKFTFVTSLRSRNTISNDIASLKKVNIDLTPNSQAIEELYTASLSAHLLDLRTKLNQLEKKVSKHYLTFSKDIKGDSFLSSLDQIYAQLELFYLNAHSIPILACDFKVKMGILYSQSFPKDNDSIVASILKIYSVFYDVYATYAKLDVVGLLPISLPIHLSYILTTCELLSDEEGIRFFKSVNLFKVNADEIRQASKDLKSRLHKQFSQSILDDSLFNQIFKTIHFLIEDKEQLEHSDPNDFIAAYLRHLSKWSKVRDISEIAGIQNRTIILLEKLNENPDKYNQSIDIQQVETICNLFTSLREKLERERCIKGLLDFFHLSAINVDDSKDDINFTPLEEIYDDNFIDEISPVSNDSFSLLDVISDYIEADAQSDYDDEIEEIIEEKESPPNYQIKQFFANGDDSKTEFFTNRKARSIWFQSNTHSLFDTFPETPLKWTFNSNLIGLHFYELMTEFLESINISQEYKQAVRLIFGPMLKLSKFEVIKLTDCPNFFTSNFGLYGKFVTVSNAQISYEFDLTIRALTELLPKNKKSDTISSKTGAQITEMIKQLTSIRSSLSMNNFEWFDILFKCYQEVNNILHETDVANEKKVIEAFQKLINLIYFSFMIGRCFIAHKMGEVHCELEMSMIKTFISDFDRQFLQNDQFSKIILHQIRSSVDNGFQSCFFDNLKVIRTFGRIIGLQLILDKLEEPFFDFIQLFSKLNISNFNLNAFINSTIFSSANFIYNSLFQAELFELSQSKYFETLSAIHSFKREVKNRPISMTVEILKSIKETYKQFSNIKKLYYIFDTISQFLPSAPLSQIKGIHILKLRTLILALKSRIFKLVPLFPSKFSPTAESFLRHMSVFDEIPQKLGPTRTDKLFAKAFSDGWSSFCSSIQPIDLSEVYSEFSHCLRVIISNLSSLNHSDITDLQTISELFLQSRNPSLIFKLRLSFLYVQQKLAAYTEVFTDSDLPFAQIYRIFDSVNLYHEFVLLTESITSHFNNNIIKDSSCPIECPSFTIDTLNQSDDYDFGIPQQLLTHQLTFSEQKQMAEDVHIYSQANEADVQRLTDLPKELTKVHALQSIVKSNQKQIDELQKAKSKMIDLIDSFTQIHQDKEETNMEDKAKKVSAVGKYFRLRYDATSLKANEDALNRQFLEKVKYNQNVENENLALTDQLAEQVNESNELTKKSQMYLYSNMIELSSNSKTIIAKTLHSIRFPSEENPRKQNRQLELTMNPITNELINLKKELAQKRDKKSNQIPAIYHRSQDQF